LSFLIWSFFVEWLEVSVEANHEAAEAIAEVLTRFAPQGVAIEARPQGIGDGKVTVRAYLLAGPDLPQTKKKVEEAIWHLGQLLPIPDPTFRAVPDTDWTEHWKEHLSVLHIGRQVVIQPTWLSYRPKEDEIVIVLDPGMAFGTGLHPTTQICLMALEDHVRPAMQLLDLGTGSGILAIAGVKLGAESVLALDNDPQAVKVARHNIRENGVSEGIKVAEGSLAQVEGTFDLVLVNILARVIIQMAKEGLADLLAPGGRLILAGIIADQEDEVRVALEQAGLEVVGRRQIEDWVGLEAM
jgi:ribosomal protein L11 methyltransferase